MKNPRDSSEALGPSRDQDNMRQEYDFSRGVRGVTAARYREGVNIVVVDPEVRDVFPDGAAVNQALRALAPLLREQQGRRQLVRRAKRTERTVADG